MSIFLLSKLLIALYIIELRQWQEPWAPHAFHHPLAEMLFAFLRRAAVVSAVISSAPSVDWYFVGICMDSK